MPLLERTGTDWFFTGGKHKGEAAQDVIEEDPSYMAWVWREVMPNLPDDAVTFLEDLLEEHGIDPYDKTLKKKS